MTVVGLRTVIRDPLAPAAFNRLGLYALRIGLVLALLLVAFLASSSTTLTIALPGLLLVGLVGWALFRRPLANLCVLLASFILIVGYEDGIQASEILWGLYYAAFMGHWFSTRFFLYRDHLASNRESGAILLFLVLISLSIGLTLMFGGDLRFFLGEWLSLSFFALYFPIREAVARHKWGLQAVLISILVVALFVQLRNFANYREILVEAVYSWQLTRGRAMTNTAIIMLPVFGGLVYLLHAKRWRGYLIGGAIFTLFFGGLILSQTRGHWLAFAVSCLVLLPVFGQNQRLRLYGIGVASILGMVAAGYLLLGNAFPLVAAGILDRVLSIGTAASDDISLLNRFRETAVVMGEVVKNPILGYGLGVPFRFWDPTYLPPFTLVTSFLHNGFVALWYKFGIWGLGLVLFFWGSAIKRGLRLYRSSAPELLRVTGLAAAAVLISFVVSAITSNPFYVNDTMFALAIGLGVIAGCDLRAARA